MNKICKSHSILFKFKYINQLLTLEFSNNFNDLSKWSILVNKWNKSVNWFIFNLIDFESINFNSKISINLIKFSQPIKKYEVSIEDFNNLIKSIFSMNVFIKQSKLVCKSYLSSVSVEYLI